MNRIFLTFFLLLLFPAMLCGREQTEYDSRTSSGIIFVYAKGTERNDRIVREIRSMDQELTRLFRLPKCLEGRKRVVISGAVPDRNIEFAEGREHTDIRISNRLDIAENPEARHRMAGILLALRAGVAPNHPLPRWISAGLEHIRRSNQSSGRIVRNSRYYPVLRAMLTAGISPSWRQIAVTEPPPMTGVERQVYEELCRVALEIFATYSTATDNALSRYAVGMVEKKQSSGELFDNTVCRRLGTAYPGISAEELLKISEERAAFNSRTPRPASSAAAKLDKLLKLKYTGKDKKEQIEDIAVLPGLFWHNPEEASQIRDRLCAAMYEFKFSLAGNVSAAVLELIQVLNSLDKDADGEEAAEILQAVDRIRAEIRRQQRLEQFVTDTENKYISPFLLFRNEMSEAIRPDDLLTEAAENFVNSVEKKYLSD